MPLLSIIIPVYNKEQFLENCFNSIFEQTFKDFELILINDGSTDGSGKICDDFKMKDDRIKVFHQENKGVSATRNLGIELSSGDYIGFIDADDEIEKDMYELLIRNIIDSNSDISACRMKVTFPNKTAIPHTSSSIKIYDNEQALRLNLLGEFDRSANNKIYKSSLISDIKFSGSIYEDILFTCKAFLLAKQTISEDTIKYNYIVRDNSVSISKFNPKYFQTIAVSAEMLSIVSKGAEGCIDVAKSFDIETNLSLINLLLITGKNKYAATYEKAKQNITSYKPFISSSKLISKKHKYACLLFLCSSPLYQFLMKIYCIISKSEAIKRI